jgi:hypothetical protein
MISHAQIFPVKKKERDLGPRGEREDGGQRSGSGRPLQLLRDAAKQVSQL